MNQTVTLRPIVAEDRDFLYQLYASTREEELALVDWDAAQKESFLRMQFSAQHQYYLENYRRAHFDVIEIAGRPIGRLYVDRRADEIRIVDIALLPEFRNHGIGSSFLKEIQAEARSMGLPVRIHVERNNPALGLYQRLGFQCIRDKGVYFLMEWRP
jgi:ribosomal protein S18 acetylase RimI-like enzyme